MSEIRNYFDRWCEHFIPTLSYGFSIKVTSPDITEIGFYYHNTGYASFNMVWNDNYGRPAGKETIHNREELIHELEVRVANPELYKHNGLP